MEKIGYARVSTVTQNLEAQKEILQDAGCEKLFIEKVTGTSTAQRKELKALFEYMREGDHIYVTKIDRLARSIIDLHKLVKEISDKGVTITFIKDNITFSPGSTNSMQSLLFNILATFAQFERDIIVERTTEGRERAKKQGKHMGRIGRPRKDIERALKLYDERETNGHSVSDIVKLTGVPRGSLYVEIRKRKKNEDL